MYAVLRSYKRFEALRNFTLESGQEEINHQNRLRKDRGESGGETSPKTSFSDELRVSPQGIDPETPTPPSQFEIGGDDDSDEEVKPKSQFSVSSQTVTSPPPQSPNPSVSSSIEDAVPLQLRGMSEKARGKLPEGAFQRQGSTASLTSHVNINSPGAPSTGFTPSSAWVNSISSPLPYCMLNVR